MWTLEDDLSVGRELLDWWDIPLEKLESLEAEYAQEWYRQGYRAGRAMTRTVGLIPLGRRAA